ncbi:MAG: YdeI/OmpD-associated family protein [Chthoniobacterales bacterium]
MNAKKEKELVSKTNPTPAAEDSEGQVPTDLRKALTPEPKAKAQWRDLTPIARRDFISWIDSAKQPETRRRRIERACSMLAAGKRRPCCYSIVSFGLYTALKAIPKAKAQWSDLTPIERRDFISWMDSAKEQPEVHKRRIEKACSILAAGKRRP